LTLKEQDRSASKVLQAMIFIYWGYRERVGANHRLRPEMFELSKGIAVKLYHQPVPLIILGRSGKIGRRESVIIMT
jgi:hypothetical protein